MSENVCRARRCRFPRALVLVSGQMISMCRKTGKHIGLVAANSEQSAELRDDLVKCQMEISCMLSSSFLALKPYFSSADYYRDRNRDGSFATVCCSQIAEPKCLYKCAEKIKLEFSVLKPVCYLCRLTCGRSLHLVWLTTVFNTLSPHL